MIQRWPGDTGVSFNIHEADGRWRHISAAGESRSDQWRDTRVSKPRDCTGEPFHQLDFWKGEWNVTVQGNPAGHNQIEEIAGGCAYIENWKGTGGGEGKSLNFYDPARDVWRQFWAGRNGTIEFEGGLREGAMVLESRAPNYTQMSFTPQPDGSVRQLWRSSPDGGKTWKVMFDGVYRHPTE